MVADDTTTLEGAPVTNTLFKATFEAVSIAGNMIKDTNKNNVYNIKKDTNSTNKRIIISISSVLAAEINF